MEITEVTITEDATVTYYSNLIPSGDALSHWLRVLVQRVALASAGSHVYLMTSEGEKIIDRNNVTDVSITMSST